MMLKFLIDILLRGVFIIFFNIVLKMQYLPSLLFGTVLYEILKHKGAFNQIFENLSDIPTEPSVPSSLEVKYENGPEVIIGTMKPYKHKVRVMTKVYGKHCFKGIGYITEDDGTNGWYDVILLRDRFGNRLEKKLHLNISEFEFLTDK